MIDLPPDSLGPVPTQKQMELLKRMATPGATVRTWTGIRSSGAYIDYHVEGECKHESFRQSDVQKFHDWGWLQHDSGDSRGHNYFVTDRARKVIEKGETRK